MKKAAVYIRVSTPDQTEYSPDAQLKAIKEYARHHDFQICDEFIFKDEGISGRKAEKRPAFMEMIKLAKSKQRSFDVILVHKFSRFARSREDSIFYKSMLRKNCGIDVISITEPVTDDKFSIIIEAMHEAMDEYYSINLASEVIKGMKEKAGRGEIQTAPPFGYVKETGMPLMIAESEAKYVRLVFDWYISGLSCFEIAKKLNLLNVRTKRGNPFESRTVRYMLNNPVYKGYARWSPAKIVTRRIFDSPETIVARSNHEPIISEELFNLAAARLKNERTANGKRSRPSKNKKHYLSGLLKCGRCGSSLCYSNGNYGFQCNKYAHGTCGTSHFIKTDKIEWLIICRLEEIESPGIYIKDKDSLLLSDSEIMRNALLEELEKLRKSLSRAREAYLRGIDSLDEYSENKASISSEIERKTILLREIREDCKESTDPERTGEKALAIADIINSKDISAEVKNKALKSIVEKIVYSKPEDTVTIYFLLNKIIV